MALRDQPYLPLYVQDVLTDEKLIDCSAEAHGVYFRLLCILHKQEVYGQICMKQKYKQNEEQIDNFALLLSKQMPFEQKQIAKCLEELISEKVLTIEGDFLFQKRMKKDGELSLMRADNGKKGGSNVTKQYGKSGYLYLMSDGYEKNKIGISVNPKNRLYRLRSDLKLPKHFEIKDKILVSNMGESEDFAQEYFKDIFDGEWLIDCYNNVKKRFDLLKAKLEAKHEAKHEANTEYENEYENENEIKLNDINSNNNTDTITTNDKKEKNTKKEKKHIPIPTESETQMFEQARKFYLGSKRGLKTEFDNFVKKYPTEWRNILPLLLPAILREKVDKEQKLKNNGFNQQWKNFSTWINGRCWEIEYPNVSEKEVNELGISVTTNESGEQKVEVKQDRSSFPLYSSMQVMPHVYPEGTESRCGYYVIKNKECVRTKKY